MSHKKSICLINAFAKTHLYLDLLSHQTVLYVPRQGISLLTFRHPACANHARRGYIAVSSAFLNMTITLDVFCACWPREPIRPVRCRRRRKVLSRMGIEGYRLPPHLSSKRPLRNCSEGPPIRGVAAVGRQVGGSHATTPHLFGRSVRFFVVNYLWNSSLSAWRELADGSGRAAW